MVSLLQKNAVRKVYRELMKNQEQQEDQENQLAFNFSQVKHSTLR